MILKEDYLDKLEKWSNTLEIASPIYLKFDDNTNKEGNYTYFNNGVYYIIITNIPYPLTEKYIILHELGHIWLRKELLNLKPSRMRRENYEEIEFYQNPLEDLCVDYHLCKQFEEHYQVLLEFLIERVLSQDLKDGLPISQYLHNYILFSGYFNFILKPRDRILHNPFIKKTIHTLGKHILNASTSEKGFYPRKLHDLNTQLITFKDIKDNIDSSKIVDYIYRVLKCLEFWNKEYITQYLDLVYNINNT